MPLQRLLGHSSIWFGSNGGCIRKRQAAEHVLTASVWFGKFKRKRGLVVELSPPHHFELKHLRQHFRHTKPPPPSSLLPAKIEPHERDATKIKHGDNNRCVLGQPEKIEQLVEQTSINTKSFAEQVEKKLHSIA